MDQHPRQTDFNSSRNHVIRIIGVLGKVIVDSNLARRLASHAQQFHSITKMLGITAQPTTQAGGDAIEVDWLRFR
jgi:hypothetical protein